MNQLVYRHSRENCPCISLWLKKEKIELLEFVELSKTEIFNIYQRLSHDMNRASPTVCKNNKEFPWIVDFVKQTVDDRFYDF